MRNWIKKNRSTLILVGALVLGVGTSSILAKLDSMLLALLVAAIAGVVLFALLLQRPFWGVLLIFFLLPFERIGALEVGGFTLRASQVVALVTLIAFVWDRLASRKFSFRPNPMAAPVLVFLLVNLFSLFSALNFVRGAEVYLFTLFVVLLFLVIPQLVVTKAQVEKMLRALFIAAVLVSIFGIYQFVGDLIGLPRSLTGLSVLYTKDNFGFPRIQSTALEPLYFANYLLIPLNIALAFMTTKLQKQRTWLWLGIIMLLGINFVLTISRGAYIGMIASILTLCVIHYRTVFSRKNLALYGVIFGVAFFAVVSLLGLSSNAKRTIANFRQHAVNVTSGASVVERETTIWQALDAWKEHPFLGIGPGNFGPLVARNPLKTPEKGWLIVNNETVELLTETGIVGLFTFIVAIYVLLARSILAIRRCLDPWLKAVLVGVFTAMIGILVQYQTFSTLYILHIWALMGFLIALQNMVLQKDLGDSQ